MEQIINQLIQNFDFALMLIINVVTYAVIKVLDELNKEKDVTTWQKRIIFVASAVVVGIIYHYYSNVSTIIIINSAIIAPVAWSWIAKPVANKLGIDYKNHNNEHK